MAAAKVKNQQKPKFNKQAGKTVNIKKGDKQNEVVPKNKNKMKYPKKKCLVTEGSNKIHLNGKTIEELKKKYEELTGKMDSQTDKLRKKELKKKIKKIMLKKEKKKRRLEKKNLNAQEVKCESVDESQEQEDSDIKKRKIIKRKDDESNSSEGEIIFNKLDFSYEEESQKKPSIDPKRALQKIEKTKSRIKELESTGRSEKAFIIKMRQSWDNAIQKAEGIKVKDNTELLKKSIKKREQRKNRSKKKWDDRNNQVEQKKAEAQKKRKQNILKKIKEKKQKKMKRAVKKGRVVL